MNKKLWMTVILVVYIIVMIIGAIITTPGDIKAVNNNDKLLHFMEFYVLSIILLKTLQVYDFKHHYIIGVVVALLFIPVSELIQMLTPSRSFSYYDMLADLLGVIAGLVAFKLGVSKWRF